MMRVSAMLQLLFFGTILVVVVVVVVVGGVGSDYFVSTTEVVDSQVDEGTGTVEPFSQKVRYVEK